MGIIDDMSTEKENDEWLRSTALSRSLDYFEKVSSSGVCTDKDVVNVAKKFYKFLKGE